MARARAGAALAFILLIVFLVPAIDYVLSGGVKVYKEWVLGKDIPLYADANGDNVQVVYYNGSATEFVSAQATWDDSVGGLVITLPASTLGGTPYVISLRIAVNDTGDPNAPWYRIFTKADKIVVQIESTDEEHFDELDVIVSTDADLREELSGFVIEDDDNGKFIATNGTVYEFEITDAMQLKALSMYSDSSFKFALIRFGEPDYTSTDTSVNLLQKTLNPGDVLIVKIKFVDTDAVDIAQYKNYAYWIMFALSFLGALVAWNVISFRFKRR